MIHVTIDNKRHWLSPKRAQELLDLAFRIDRECTVYRIENELDIDSLTELGKWLNRGLPVCKDQRTKN